MQWFISTYASLLQRHRGVVAISVAVVTAVLVYNIFGLKADLQLMGAVKLEHLDESADERDIVERAQNSCVVILSEDEIFSPKGISVVRTLDEQLSAINGVNNVESLYDMRVVRHFGDRSVFLMLLPPPDSSPERIARAKEQAIDHPLAAGNLITTDGAVTSFAVSIDPAIRDVKDLKSVIDQIHATVDQAIQETTFQVHYTGIPEIRVRTSDVVVQDQLIFNVVGALAGMTVNLFLLRRVAAVAIVSAGSWLGVAWTFGIFALLGQPLTPINGIVAPLAMTIGLTDSIHLLLSIRRMREAGLSRVDATITSLRDVGLACTLTSLTTVIGFLSLNVANLELLRNLGFCCAVAVVAAYTTVLTVVPLLSLTWLGDHIVAPERRESGKDPFPSRLADLVISHRWAFFFGGVAFTILLAALTTQLHSDSHLADALPEHARQALVYSDDKFDGTIPILLRVEWAEDAKVTQGQIIGALEDVSHALDESHHMSPPLSLINVLRLFPEGAENGPQAAFHELKHWPARARNERDLAIDFKNRSMYVYLRSKDVGSHAISKDLADFEKARQSLVEKYPGFSFRLLDSLATSSPVTNEIVSDLMMSMTLAVPVTLGIVAAAFGSPYFAAVALLPNVFPMFALAATLVVCGQPLLLVGAVVFTFSFGVAVDDTIHVLSSFKRISEDEPDVAQVIAAVYKKVGGALVASTLILTVGMGVVVLSRTLLVRAFGVMFCIALAFALVADLIILPATLACFPRKFRKSKTETEPSEGT